MSEALPEKKDLVPFDPNKKPRYIVPPSPDQVSRFGASIARNLEICPSWLPEVQFETRAADEGELLHSACEHRSIEGLTEEQAGWVNLCVGYLDKLKSEMEHPEDHRERKFPFFDLCNVKIDNLLIDDDEAHVVDFKFGWKATDDAEINRQGWTYSVSIFEWFKNVHKVTVHFLQPKLDSLSMHSFTREGDLERLTLALKTISERTMVEPDKREYHYHCGVCLYCGRKLVCRAMQEAVLKINKLYDEENSRLSVDELPHQLIDGAKMAKWIPLAQNMKRWAFSLLDNATQFALAGNEVPGYTLQERQGQKNFVAERKSEALGALQEAGFLTGDDLAELADFSVNAVVDRAARKAWALNVEKAKALPPAEREGIPTKLGANVAAVYKILYDLKAIHQADPTNSLKVEAPADE